MRREKTITLEDRGNKLTFKLREMSATKSERWILRGLKLLGSAGIPVPDGADLLGVARFVHEHAQEVIRDLDLNDAVDLMNDLLGMCSRVVGKVEEPCSYETVDDYIEDAATLFRLRVEALKFFFAQYAKDSRSTSRPGPTIQLHEPQA